MDEFENQRSSISEILNFVGERLAEAEISHTLIGGIAVGLHGYQRATADIDFLIDGLQREAAKDALEAVGFNCMAQTPETLHFSGPGAVDLLLANRPQSKAMFGRQGQKTRPS